MSGSHPYSDIRTLTDLPKSASTVAGHNSRPGHSPDIRQYKDYHSEIRNYKTPVPSKVYYHKKPPPGQANFEDDDYESVTRFDPTTTYSMIRDLLELYCKAKRVTRVDVKLHAPLRLFEDERPRRQPQMEGWRLAQHFEGVPENVTGFVIAKGILQNGASMIAFVNPDSSCYWVRWATEPFNEPGWGWDSIIKCFVDDGALVPNTDAGVNGVLSGQDRINMYSIFDEAAMEAARIDTAQERYHQVEIVTPNGNKMSWASSFMRGIPEVVDVVQMSAIIRKFHEDERT